ncbi:M-phase inducer phosphatase [Tolypocladium ophioglossoides CBS 100239]|uniref:M-phase inducer phosphatase n=1 Tax=Tolypocladium ophioglossoides (strain CBS 100239) TaxID=1163406 RepID=A0A0L0NM61_TOLOC|nr:M-phase inducer phosphatase [Tolypocladium ophioglossoides CBS 100239]
MEASSPLAALHRPMMPAPAWGSRDIFRPRPHSLYSSGSGSSFGLREQLHRSGDYFNVKDVRGSSPAASLAADLSQNFRIDNDASPHFPTPRLALFTANMMGGMEGRHYVTTPPLPSSSPAPMTELMEVSPLPHKLPFNTQIEITSPTPMSTPPANDDHDDDMMLDSPAPITRQASLESPKPILADRKIAAPRRPSLSRMKGLTTSSIPSRAQADPQLPAFRFGADSGVGHASPSLSLGECFESTSPPQERRPQSANSPCASITMGSRPRPLFVGMAGPSNHRLGSPMNCHSRRQSNPFLRNRKQFRRSLSMFEHPADIMKPKPEGEEANSSSLKSVAAIEEAHEPALPHFLPEDPADTIPRISKETLLEVLDGKYTENFDQKMVIDCRFEYEYDGGHIEGAVNHNDKELLASQLFETPMSGRTLLVFHCEYSAHRAPLMARHVRSEDRTVNAEHYPKLTYPEVYILDGGYSGFFAEHRGRCYPPEYVEMSDEKHQRTCEREMGRLKSRKGLGRAQTFAFGQREPCVNDSPTGPSRPASRLAPASMLGHSPIPNPVPGERSPARRMASY